MIIILKYIICLQVEGEWNGKMMAKYSCGKSELFLDMTSMPCVHKEVKRVSGYYLISSKSTLRSSSEQEKYESRRLWREVTHGLKFENIDSATTAKQGLEQVGVDFLQQTIIYILMFYIFVVQKQREEARQRKETGVIWESRLFHSIGDQWHFKKPLGNRNT